MARAKQIPEINELKAAKELLLRKERVSHPDGIFDNANRWYPDDSERCDCCNAVRNPSRNFPWSLMTHCRSSGHVANLMHCDASELRAANVIKKYIEITGLCLKEFDSSSYHGEEYARKSAEEMTKKIVKKVGKKRQPAKRKEADLVL